MTDIVQIFADAANDADYQFAYGRKDILNYEAGLLSLSGGETVLMVFPFVENAQISNGIINQWSASTQIWLGRKFDESISGGTYAELDETEKQKYDRRLKSLRDDLNALIKTIFCNNDLELTNAIVFRELNQFDENIDFVTANPITFLFDNS